MKRLLAMDALEAGLETKQSLLLSSADLNALVLDKAANLQRQADLEALRTKLEHEFVALKEELSV